MLISESHGLIPVLATVVYSLSLVGLFGCSALYHRPTWSSKYRDWMKRIDHAAIFVLIAGTGTPVSLLAVGGETGNKLLGLFWITALVGILQSLFWVKAPKWVSATIYVAVGWVGLPFMDDLRRGLGPTGIMLLVTGGVIYSLGAVIYAMKRPNWFPKFFGYHELFHVLVIIAAGFHFLCIQRLVSA